MNYVLYVKEKNRNTGRVSPPHGAMDKIRAAVANKTLETVEIRILGTRELLHVIPARFVRLITLVDNLWTRQQSYTMYSYAAALKVMSRPAEFMTQLDIAQHYGFHPSRVAILKDFGMLEVDHKVGKTEYYHKEDVLSLAKDRRFKTYLNNVYERQEAL